MHPFFEVVEGGGLNLRVGVAERHDHGVSQAAEALPGTALEHGQNWSVRFVPAHGGAV